MMPSWEEISSEIEFLAAVRKGSKQIAEGKIIPHGTHRASRSSQPISADGPTSSEDCKSSNPGSDSRRLSDCLRDRREPRGSGNLQNLAFRQGITEAQVIRARGENFGLGWVQIVIPNQRLRVRAIQVKLVPRGTSPLRNSVANDQRKAPNFRNSFFWAL